MSEAFICDDRRDEEMESAVGESMNLQTSSFGRDQTKKYYQRFLFANEMTNAEENWLPKFTEQSR